MPLTEFKILSFGCYGTLVDKKSGVYTALQPLLRSGNVTLSRDDVLASFTQHELAQEEQAPKLPYSDVLAEVHRRLAKEWYAVASNDDHVLFGKSVAHWPVFADTPAALQYLRRYFKLVILSNADRESFAASNRRFGVKFDIILTAQDIGSFKPSLKNFEHMIKQLEKLGLAKENVLHTAQSLFHDHAPAATLGIASAWIDRCHETEASGTTLPPPIARYDYQFSSLAAMVKAHQEQLMA